MQYKDKNTKPSAIEVNPENIPDELKRDLRWCVWDWWWDERQGRWTKPPQSPKTGRFAKVNDPSTFGTFDEAWDTYSKNRDKWDGIGALFTSGSGYVGIDLDDVCDTPERYERANNIIEAIDSYTEYSPSGNGIRIVTRAQIPTDGKNKNKIEIYAGQHYLTFTGSSISENTSIRNSQDKVMELYQSIAGDEEIAPNLTVLSTQQDDHYLINPTSTSILQQKEGGRINTGGGGESDQAVLNHLRRIASGPDFTALFDHGDASRFKDKDLTDRDFALCRKLAWRVGPDQERIDRLFRQSACMRPKWDEVRFADKSTYGQGTIKKAINWQNTKKSYYSPDCLTNEGINGQIYTTTAITIREDSTDSTSLTSSSGTEQPPYEDLLREILRLKDKEDREKRLEQENAELKSRIRVKDLFIEALCNGDVTPQTIILGYCLGLVLYGGREVGKIGATALYVGYERKGEYHPLKKTKQIGSLAEKANCSAATVTRLLSDFENEYSMIRMEKLIVSRSKRDEIRNQTRQQDIDLDEIVNNPQYRERKDGDEIVTLSVAQPIPATFDEWMKMLAQISNPKKQGGARPQNLYCLGCGSQNVKTKTKVKIDRSHTCNDCGLTFTGEEFSKHLDNTDKVEQVAAPDPEEFLDVSPSFCVDLDLITTQVASPRSLKEEDLIECPDGWGSFTPSQRDRSPCEDCRSGKHGEIEPVPPMSPATSSTSSPIPPHPGLKGCFQGGDDDDIEDETEAEIADWFFRGRWQCCNPDKEWSFIFDEAEERRKLRWAKDREACGY